MEVFSTEPQGILGNPRPLIEDTMPPSASPSHPSPVAEASSSTSHVSVKSLTPITTTLKHPWTIRVKVVEKSQMATWTNPAALGLCFQWS
jgi:hypothetical protein